MLVAGASAAVVYTINYVAPNFYPSVGTLMNNLINPIALSTTPTQIGQAMQNSMRDPWCLGPSAELIHDTGGDYGAADDWTSIPYMPAIGGAGALKPPCAGQGLCHEF